jgi:DNA sulfur modification protein DndB
MYGSGAGTQFHRRLQAAVRVQRHEFDPPGLDEWLAAQDKQFNLDASDIVRELETFFRVDIRKRLQDEFGTNWERDGIPRKVREAILHRAIDINIERDSDKQVTAWDSMYLIEVRDVLVYNENLWKRLYEKRYTRPGEEGVSGRKNRTEWLVNLNRIRNDTAHDRGISETDYTFLLDLRSWLLRDEVDNELPA